MSEANNPYLPPKAAVADPLVAAPKTRPMAINIALILIGVRLLYTSIWLVMTLRSTDLPNASAILIAVVSAGVSIALGFAVARGRNWARVVFLVLAAIALLSLLFALASRFGRGLAGVSTELSLSALATMLVPLALLIAIVVLLYGPGREWFRPRE
jgi:hypothetical protein